MQVATRRAPRAHPPSVQPWPAGRVKPQPPIRNSERRTNWQQRHPLTISFTDTDDPASAVSTAWSPNSFFNHTDLYPGLPACSCDVIDRISVVLPAPRNPVPSHQQQTPASPKDASRLESQRTCNDNDGDMGVDGCHSRVGQGWWSDGSPCGAGPGADEWCMHRQRHPDARIVSRASSRRPWGLWAQRYTYYVTPSPNAIEALVQTNANLRGRRRSTRALLRTS